MNTKKENLQIRDFIYLDVDRLKSILSQIERGLIESKTETSSSSKEILGEGGLSIPAILKAAGGVKFLLENRSTETKTLHDHIYNYVEDELTNKGQLININKSSYVEAWKNGIIHEDLSQTSFILAKGHFVINDYEYMKNILERFNDISEFIAYCGTLENKNSIPQKEKTKQFHRARTEMKLDRKLVKGLLNFIDTFYKNRLIIKVLPFRDYSNFRLVGNLQDDFLRDKIQSILYKYGTSPSSEWILFAQIASMPEKSYHSFSIDGMAGSKIEVAMQSVFSALREIESTGLSVTYPEISVTPIAIYRE